MKLIIPVAGSSTRYPGTRPKWLLTMPNGQLMIEKSLSGINLEQVSEIVLIMLEEHKKYIEPKILEDTLKKVCNNIPVLIFVLENPTFSQPSTISKYLNKRFDIESKIYVTDNFIFSEIYCPDWNKF